MPKSIVIIFVITAAGILFSSCAEKKAAGRDFYRKGMNAYQKKDLESARKLFELSYRNDSSNLNALLMNAKIDYFEKKYDQALAGVSSVINKDESHVNALYWKARILVMKGDSSGEALHLLRKVTEKDSHHLQARLLLALLYEKKGEYGRAFREYAMIKKEGNALIDACTGLSLLYMKKGMEKRAHDEIEKAAGICRIIGADDKRISYFKKEIQKWGKERQR